MTTNLRSKKSSLALQLLKWATTPSLLNGLALGILISILVGIVWQLELARIVIAVLVCVALLLCLGAIFGIGFYRSKSRSLEASVTTSFTSSLRYYAAEARTMGTQERQALEQELIAKAESGLSSIGNSIVRFLALGRLFAISGVIVSFSIFVATYLQVDRLSEQNRLIQLQSLSAHQQISLQMRAEASAVRTMSTLATELLVIEKDIAPLLRDVEVYCSEVKSSVQNTLENLEKANSHREGVYFGVTCLKQIADLLVQRTSNLEANRLINQQVGGSALRLNIVTRDIAEQFSSQFVTLCESDPIENATVARSWGHLRNFEATALSLQEALTSPANDEETIYLLGTPEETIVSSITPFMSRTDEKVDLNELTIAALSQLLVKDIKRLSSYLQKQESACGGRADRLRRDIELIDAEFARLLQPFAPTEQNTAPERINDTRLGL